MKKIHLSKYTGINQFGPAYQIMLENDLHASDSVDRVLMARMVRLCPETAEYLYTAYSPIETKYQKGLKPELERYVNDVIAGCKSSEDQIRGIASFCSGLSVKAEGQSLDDMLFGGTEEEIIQCGSDMCTDVARIGCAMCQIAGFPSRMVYLFDTEQAYSGHVIIEVFRNGIWGTVDTSTSVIYHYPDGKLSTTWDLMKNPHLIDFNREVSGGFYTTVGQFRGSAISNYFVWEKYNYTVSKINDYYRSILEMSEKGWLGGLRWLHGEDETTGYNSFMHH
ncbi:MAG: hypothetical protein QG641_1603 [Candidatus Poribacteria bacterium]|nr:hypothetical protein [Candidatus Poribacteria bacterium]